MGNKSIESIRISIIIPCYNASAYSMQLSDCIDKQLLVDSQSEMEFILVNDGSNDDTLERLLSIKEKHPFQVSIINQPNMGVSAARNAGIAQARGKWIGFMDSDDIYREGALSFLSECINEDDVDVLVYASKILSQVSQVSAFTSTISRNVVFEGNSCDYYLKSAPIVVWRMLYRTSVIRSNDIRFRPITIGEDTLFNFEVFMLGVKVKEIDSVLYYHIDRPNSLTTAVDYAYVHRVIYSAQKIQEVYNDYIANHVVSSGILSKIREQRNRNVSFVFFKLLSSTVRFKRREIVKIRSSFEALGAFPIAATTRSEKVINFVFRKPIVMTCLYYLLRLKKKLK